MECILCNEQSVRFFTDGKMNVSYWHCGSCDLRFMDPSDHLEPDEERRRYLHHESDVDDLGYQGFIEPLRLQIQSEVRKGAEGLDYGCGKNPVFGQLLQRDGYSVSNYDLYFHPDAELLHASYEFVYAVEVVEHFYRPMKDWKTLKACVGETGQLGIMTQLYSGNIDFNSWYYRRDPTHVCFYSLKTMRWLQTCLGFRSVQLINNRTVWFR